MGTVRNSPFLRQSPSPAPPSNRPKSALFPSPLAPPTTRPASPSLSNPVRGQALEIGFGNQDAGGAKLGHVRNLSKSTSNRNSGTFAPSFIKTEELKRDVVSGIEGENDFSGKRYVWLKDPHTAFVKGWVVEDLGGNRILVQCDDGSVRVGAPTLDSLPY